MARWDNILKKKFTYIIIGTAVISLILGPILGAVLNKIIIYERKPQVIQEDSTLGINKAFSFFVELEKNQKLIVEISEYYINCTVTIKILSNSIFQSASLANSTPGSVSGMEFVYSQFGWGTSPAGGTVGASALTLPTTVRYAYIEFMGSRNGDALISWPGEYVVIVYGTNSGGPGDINVYFDITIKIDGPGDTLSDIFMILGVFLLLFYFIAAIVIILKKNFFR